jgi:hypothetical protein
MFSTVMRTRVMAAMVRWLSSEFSTAKPIPLRAGMSAIGRVTTTAVTVITPAQR